MRKLDCLYPALDGRDRHALGLVVDESSDGGWRSRKPGLAVVTTPGLELHEIVAIAAKRDGRIGPFTASYYVIYLFILTKNHMI